MGGNHLAQGVGTSGSIQKKEKPSEITQILSLPSHVLLSHPLICSFVFTARRDDPPCEGQGQPMSCSRSLSKCEA